MKNEYLTELLNLKCRDSQVSIDIFEVVALYNWGFKSRDTIIGYGHFEWNENRRKMDIIPHERLNKCLVDNYSGLDLDSYDLFRTSPRKLNDNEKKYL